MAIAEVGGGSQRAARAGGISNLTLAYPANVTSGNLLIAGGCGFLNGGCPAPTILDTLLTSYTVLSAIPFTNGRIWIAFGVAPSSGANTVTVTFVGSVGNSFSIDEFSGQHATPLDIDGGQTTATSITASDTLTTLTANALLIGCSAYDAGDTTFVEGASYTLIGKEASNTFQDHLLEFRLVTTAQLYTVTATIGASVPNSMYTAGFKPSSGNTSKFLACLGVG